MKMKTKNAKKKGFTSTINLALNEDLNLLKTPGRRSIRVMEVKKLQMERSYEGS